MTKSLDSTIRQWEAQSGAKIGAPLRHKGTVIRLAVNADGSVIATGSSDGKIQRLEFRTWAKIDDKLSDLKIM